jgi:hypothetical protein
MAAAINNFTTVTANLTANIASVYSTPVGYSSVILLCQISNISNNAIATSGYHLRSGTPTALLQNYPVPVNDAVSMLTGRLVMIYGDSLQFSANVNTGAQLLLSILETSTS